MNERELIEFAVAQRWFGSKAREVTQARTVDSAALPPGPYTIAIVEFMFPEGTHENYQLLPGAQDGDVPDGLADPSLARELVHAMRTGATLQAQEGVISFLTVGGFADVTRELASVRLIASEQSNSSVVFDEELILKVFRRLEPGVNPELEMLRYLTERGFSNSPQLAGW